MNTFKWTVPELSEGNEENRREIFRLLGILNLAITATAIIFPIGLKFTEAGSNPWALITFMILWSIIACLLWGASVLFLLVILAKKEKVKKTAIMMNQSPFILALALFAMSCL